MVGQQAISYHKSMKRHDKDDCFKAEKDVKGVNPTSKDQDKLFALTYNMLKGYLIDDDMLRFGFVGYDGKLLRAFRLLELIFVAGHRNMSYYSRVLNSNNKMVNGRLKLLLDYGYIGKIVKPRKLMILNSYTSVDVYYVNTKGKGFIKSIYESVGLL